MMMMTWFCVDYESIVYNRYSFLINIVYMTWLCIDYESIVYIRYISLINIRYLTWQVRCDVLIISYRLCVLCVTGVFSRARDFHSCVISLCVLDKLGECPDNYDGIMCIRYIPNIHIVICMTWTHNIPNKNIIKNILGNLVLVRRILKLIMSKNMFIHNMLGVVGAF